MRRLPLRLPASTPHAATTLLSATAVATAVCQGQTHAHPYLHSHSQLGPRPRPHIQALPWAQHQHQQRAAFVSSSSSSPPPPPPPSKTAPATSAPSIPTDGDNTLPSDSEPQPELDIPRLLHLPFRFATGVALFAKRPPRPFPPPFLSPPSGSFSDPLSTHDRSRDRRKAYVDGHRIKGYTNGDDAVFASDFFICANDGVGAWSTRERGHAGLWSRLILHYWATAMMEDAVRHRDDPRKYVPDPVAYLQRAYEQTVEATSPPNDWQGTTTAAGAQLFYRKQVENQKLEPLLYVTNVGDSQVMVVRPATRELVYKSTEQWHWFDCPRQLGTNSPDTPATCAVVDEVPIREGDVVLAMSDGVIDNLWAHEIAENVCTSLDRWRTGEVKGRSRMEDAEKGDSRMGFVAEELMEAAKVIAMDPFAESPFMEHAIEEGLASGGGKMDDISVVAALCERNDV